MKEEFKPRHKEFFECDCYGKDHLIRAEYEIDEWTPKDGITRKFHELTIVFTTKLADYNSTYQTGIFGWFKRMKWRIQHAFRLLFTGEVETEGYFIPCRTWIDEKENTIEGQFGYKTTKDLATFLNVTADKIKEAHEKEWEEFKKAQESKEKV